MILERELEEKHTIEHDIILFQPLNDISGTKTAPPAMSIIYLMWITSISLLVIKTNCKPSDITLITRPMLHDSEKDTTWSGGVALGQTFWCEYKASGPKGSHLSPSKSLKKKHYIKYNYKTVLLAQCSGRKFLAVAKSIKFCLTWIFVLCEVMRKMEHLVILGITHT